MNRRLPIPRIVDFFGLRFSISPTTLFFPARRMLRTSEAALVMLAVGIGLLAGLAAMIQSGFAHLLHAGLFGLAPHESLSGQDQIAPWRLLALPLGGLVLAWLGYRMHRNRSPVDVVEANALHGGVIPVRDTVAVVVQTLVSNGVGASVGLEAAYAQAGGGLASSIGQRFRLRRSDLRVLVAAGAGAAIGAAFGTPLTGAFYAFEIVLGAYAPAAIAPVLAASLAGTVVMRTLGVPSYQILLSTTGELTTVHYFIFAALGLLCAMIAIVIMQMVTALEMTVRRSAIPPAWRPAIGGLILIPLALITPQILSAGHGALQLNLTIQAGLFVLCGTFLLKVAASAVSLGFGFRGGLFFASLFLGSLFGQVFALVFNLAAGVVVVDPSDAALVGMAAMAVAVVGGPMTMSLLILEITHDFSLTAVALTASLCSSTLVREAFGFSFSTWRLHARGETIRSARDVGWTKTMTAEKLMRRDVPTIDGEITIQEFRTRFPLGTVERYVAIGRGGRYLGIVSAFSAFSTNMPDDTPVEGLAVRTSSSVRPDADILQITQSFERDGVDELPVMSSDGTFLGLLSELHVRKRYASAVDRSHRELFGE